jgi:hypothetical protein
MTEKEDDERALKDMWKEVQCAWGSESLVVESRRKGVRAVTSDSVAGKRR